jgi:hypothetical protein
MCGLAHPMESKMKSTKFTMRLCVEYCRLIAGSCGMTCFVCIAMAHLRVTILMPSTQWHAIVHSKLSS